MFKNISINLTAPICQCELEKLSWQIFLDPEGKCGLMVQCQTCKSTLTVPNSQFRAFFVFDSKYPGKKELPKENKSEEYDAEFLKGLRIKTDGKADKT